jgi:hypothetical protein
MVVATVKIFYFWRAALRFFNDGCQRVNAVLYMTNRMGLAWRLNPISRMPDNSLPNFCLEPSAGGEAVMVGEGKVRRFQG